MLKAPSFGNLFFIAMEIYFLRPHPAINICNNGMWGALIPSNKVAWNTS
jgi:hypothetical protein